jgi:hypothetical protein
VVPEQQTAQQQQQQQQAVPAADPAASPKAISSSSSSGSRRHPHVPKAVCQMHLQGEMLLLLVAGRRCIRVLLLLLVGQHQVLAWAWQRLWQLRRTMRARSRARQLSWQECCSRYVV